MPIRLIYRDSKGGWSTLQICDPSTEHALQFKAAAGARIVGAEYLDDPYDPNGPLPTEEPEPEPEKTVENETADAADTEYTPGKLTPLGFALEDSGQQASGTPEPAKRPRGRPRGQKEKGEGYTDAFFEWWSAYPSSKNKRAAFQAYERAVTRLQGDKGGKQAAQNFLLAKAQSYAESGEAAERTFVPHGATWLNKGKYDDDPAEWTARREPTQGNGSAAGRRRLDTSHPEDGDRF